MTKEELNGYSYRITQASKTELIVIMYEMAETYLNDAVAEYEIAEKSEKVEYEGFRNSLKKAQRVVNELSSSLDMQYDISNELFNLYLYMNKTINNASLKKNIKEIPAILRMIARLKSSFSILSKQDLSGPIMKNTQQVYAGLTYSNGGLNETMNQTANRGFTV